MEGFIIRVTTYHGEPKPVGASGIPARSGVSVDTAVSGEVALNVPDDSVIVDLDVDGPGPKASSYDLDKLIDDFEDEYRCKVNRVVADEHSYMYEFDVFEPSWLERDRARSVNDELTRRIVDWVSGHPS